MNLKPFLPFFRSFIIFLSQDTSCIFFEYKRKWILSIAYKNSITELLLVKPLMLCFYYEPTLWVVPSICLCLFVFPSNSIHNFSSSSEKEGTMKGKFAVLCCVDDMKYPMFSVFFNDDRSQLVTWCCSKTQLST